MREGRTKREREREREREKLTSHKVKDKVSRRKLSKAVTSRKSETLTRLNTFIV